jgi:hypothetical protein
MIGAAAPEVVRLYKVITDPPQPQLPPGNVVVDPAHHSHDYWLRRVRPLEAFVSVMFLCLGGAFAVACGENSQLKCLWVGASLPAIVSAYSNRVPTPPS